MERQSKNKHPNYFRSIQFQKLFEFLMINYLLIVCLIFLGQIVIIFKNHLHLNNLFLQLYTFIQDSQFYTHLQKLFQKVMYGYYISQQEEMDKQNAQFSQAEEIGSPNQESITFSTLQQQVYLQKCKVYQETQSKLNSCWKNVAKEWTIMVLMIFILVVITAVYILNSNVGYVEDQPKGEKNSLAYNENNTKKVKRLKNVQKRLEKIQPEYKQIEHFGISTLKKLNTPLSKFKNQVYQVKCEDLQYEYDVNGGFSLWDINPTYKKTLFSKYKALPQSKIVFQDKDYIDINYGKDEQFIEFAKDHQSTIQIIKWHSLKLSISDVKRISDDFEGARMKRRMLLQKLLKKYKQEYEGRQGLMNPKKNITYKRFLQSLEYEKLTGQDFKQNFLLKKVYQREKQYYRKNYRTDKTKYEIPACIIAPTYNNVIDHRYLWHLQSILQQDYKNYKLIIIDDASTDQTASRISQYLKWRNADPQKVILIKNRKHKTAMPNLYYSVHKYCDYNQILYIIDGDDEIVGTQVFQLFNALYQQRKYYMFYSSHFQYESKNQTHPLLLGLPFAYPESLKKKAGYRTYEHAYSQLRTVMSDLILLLKTQSLRDHTKSFYWTISDNAIYFSAMELSCGRVDYIPQLEYWYNADTSVNDWRTTEQKRYRRVKKHINFEQRHYRCIHSTIRKIRAAVEAGNQN